MAGQLQRRYIWISAVVLCALVILLLVSINLSFGARADARNAELLAFVQEYGNDPQRAFDAADSSEAVILAENSGKSPYMALETTSYFTGIVDESGSKSVDLTGAVELTEEEATALLEAARIEGLKQGRVGRFQFTRSDADEAFSYYAFIDVSESVLERVQLSMASIGAGAIALSVILVYIWLSALGVIRPMERRVDAGGRLMASSAQILEHTDEPRAVRIQAASLAAGSTVLESGAIRKAVVSLTDVVSAACARYEQDICRRARLAADLQQGVHVRGRADELEAMCRLMLAWAAGEVRSEGVVHVDLLSDGRQAGLIVRCTAKPFEEDEDPNAEILAALRLIAANSDGTVSFDVIAPDILCYTVKFRAVEKPGFMAANTAERSAT